MDFALSPNAADHLGRLQAFMDEQIYPAEPTYHEQRLEAAERGSGLHAEHAFPPVMEELKVEARKRGLWNLFLPDADDPAHGLKVHEYAPMAELTGWSPHLAPQAINCSAPDTGNMEVLHLFGSQQQKERWLQPLLDGEIRSAFAMTEPDVASSDAANISISIVRDGDHYVINGKKWWISGAADPRCAFFILMGKTDPSASAYRQQSMIIVPTDTPGVDIVRALPVYGFQHQEGHCEISFTDVRVPVSNLVGEEGGGFMIAQARLGPGRIHHCMRAIGSAERALKLMCERATSRIAFGRTLAEQGTVQDDIARSRMEIDQARLYVMQTAWKIDTYGVKAARTDIAGIKVVVPNMALAVIDRAVQVHGGAGVTDVTPLAEMWAGTRTLRIADGPDAVHVRSVARAELAPYLPKK